MSFSRNRHRTRTAGFTLIEILIVVMVLGIIMSIVISTLINARDKARQGATIADMRNLSSAIEAYTVDYSLPPETMVFTDLAQLLKPYHNQNVPVNDHWGHAYEYVRSDPQTYSLTSFGKDGIQGAEMTPDTRSEFNRDIVVANGRFPGLP